MAAADMLKTANAKKASRRYFRLRSGKSNQRGRAKLRRKVERPSFHRYSESVPMGQSHPQNDLRRRNDISRNAVKRKNPALFVGLGISFSGGQQPSPSALPKPDSQLARVKVYTVGPEVTA